MNIFTTFAAERLERHNMNILITGATGFIGGFIVDEALSQGYNVWVAVRRSSSKRYLQDPRINFVDVNLGDKGQIESKIRGLRIDYVVHAAGVTKSTRKQDFHDVNTLGTRNLVDALIETKMPIKRFVFVSSLSVCGPLHEQQPYKEITADDIPQPNTAYGKSKLEAEKYLESLKDFPYIILRPTGVYGPRERDYFMMAKSIKGHTDFAVGYKPQDITFIYVLDLVKAIFLSLDKGKIGSKYALSDGKVYNSRTFSDLIIKELGNPRVLRIKAPIWLLRIITLCGEYYGRLTGKVTALNNDKYNIMRQRNWRCDIRPAIDELGYRPEYDLERGVELTIAWYKENGWL